MHSYRRKSLRTLYATFIVALLAGTVPAEQTVGPSSQDHPAIDISGVADGVVGWFERLWAAYFGDDGTDESPPGADSGGSNDGGPGMDPLG
jgi:hypothetical protein